MFIELVLVYEGFFFGGGVPLSLLLRILHSYEDVTITSEGLQSTLNSLLYATPTVTQVPTLYNGHLWGHMTLTPVVEHLTVELSLPVFMT